MPRCQGLVWAPSRCVNTLCSSANTPRFEIDVARAEAVCVRCGCSQRMAEVPPTIQLSEERFATFYPPDAHKTQNRDGFHMIGVLVGLCSLPDVLEERACQLYAAYTRRCDRHEFITLAPACLLFVLHDVRNTRSLRSEPTEMRFACLYGRCDTHFSSKKCAKYHFPCWKKRRNS